MPTSPNPKKPRPPPSPNPPKPDNLRGWQKAIRELFGPSKE